MGNLKKNNEERELTPEDETATAKCAENPRCRHEVLKTEDDNSAYLQKPLLREQQQSFEFQINIAEHRRLADERDQARLGMQVLLREVEDEKRVALMEK